ncbi:hypothetical protein B9T62_06980 [Paenibacillus donghaensis]|uniref:Uncharacterized protein n=1 Tax=Paenibacillus donghaensis TaxID=414771 RepID=A0A2Z2K6Q0_9BACL|nr:hypothetical protein B9T62_06980 [Paenibacillus donghaensis]
MITAYTLAMSAVIPLAGWFSDRFSAKRVFTRRDGLLAPWSIHILEMEKGKIAHIHHFIDSDLFVRFGLPTGLDAKQDFLIYR